MKQIYSNQAPLLCAEFPSLKRQIGVSVYQYHEEHWNVEYERVSLNVNTATFGKGISTPMETQEQVIKSTWAVIENLDKVIDELQDHRRRLFYEVDSISKNGITYKEATE
jgi:hypothetical protein